MTGGKVIREGPLLTQEREHVWNEGKDGEVAQLYRGKGEEEIPHD